MNKKISEENLSEQLNDALERKTFFTEKRDELEEKLNHLTNEERNDLEKEEKELLEKYYAEKNEANDAYELSQIKSDEFEVLTEHYPYGVSLLENEIEKIDDEISNITKLNSDRK